VKELERVKPTQGCSLNNESRGPWIFVNVSHNLIWLSDEPALKVWWIPVWYLQHCGDRRENILDQLSALNVRAKAFLSDSGLSVFLTILFQN